MAFDLWLITCMGFRKKDLLKLIIVDGNGEFYSIIKMYEEKNKNITYRFIPDSICQLQIATGYSLPMTLDRI